jgi:hypothetical protein
MLKTGEAPRDLAGKYRRKRKKKKIRALNSLKITSQPFHQNHNPTNLVNQK